MKGLYKFNDFIERWMAFVTPSCLLFGVLFPQIAKHGVPYVPYVFAFITFTGALKSRFRDVANVFKAPWALLVIMLLLHLVIPGVACGVGNLVFPDNTNLVTGMVLEFAVPTAVVSMMWVTIYGGNSALTLALIVIDTVLAPFLIPLTLRLFVGSRVTIDMTHMIRRLIFMVAVPALGACAGNTSEEAGAVFKNGTDLCRRFQFLRGGTIRSSYDGGAARGGRADPLSGCRRLPCRNGDCPFYGTGPGYADLDDVRSRYAQYQCGSGDRHDILSGRGAVSGADRHAVSAGACSTVWKNPVR